MKRIFLWVALAAVSLSLTSCLEGSQQSSPGMSAGMVTRHAVSGVHDTITYSDTVQVGDTLYAPFLLYGGFNNLTSFQVSTDTSAWGIKLFNDSSYLHLLGKDSKPENGYLQFVAGCSLFETTMRYIAKRAGDYNIALVISSDAGDPYSPLELQFVQPIR